MFFLKRSFHRVSRSSHYCRYLRFCDRATTAADRRDNVRKAIKLYVIIEKITLVECTLCSQSSTL